MFVYVLFRLFHVLGALVCVGFGVLLDCILCCDVFVFVVLVFYQLSLFCVLCCVSSWYCCFEFVVGVVCSLAFRVGMFMFVFAWFVRACVLRFVVFAFAVLLWIASHMCFAVFWC